MDPCLGPGLSFREGSSCVELAFRDDLFDHADPDGAAHVADSKPSKFWNVRERFQDHVVQGLHLHQGTVADLEETRLLFDHLACSWVDFLDQFLESHPDRSSVRMKHRSVSCSDGSWVVDYDDLSDEFFRYRRWLVRVAHSLSPSDLVLCNSSDVEADVVSRLSLRHPNMMGLDRFYLAELSGGIKDDLVTIFHNTRLDTPHRHSSNTGDCVHVLNRNAKRLVQGFRWRNEIVKGIVHCNSLVPGRVRALLRQVVAQPSAGRHERDL